MGNYSPLALVAKGPFQRVSYSRLALKPLEILLESVLFSHPLDGLSYNEAFVPRSRCCECFQ